MKWQCGYRTNFKTKPGCTQRASSRSSKADILNTCVLMHRLCLERYSGSEYLCWILPGKDLGGEEDGVS